MPPFMLSWAFGQLFGSKAKAFFDASIAPSLDAGVAHKPHELDQLLASFTGPSVIGPMTDKLMAGVKIPPMYKSIASAMLTQWVSDSINRAFKIKAMSLNPLTPPSVLFPPAGA